MKKLLYLILFGVFLTLCCGCDKLNSDVIAVTSELKFISKIEYNDEIYEFEVEIPKNSKVIMKTLSPKRIKGTVFEVSENIVTVNLEQLEYKTSLHNLPSVSPVRFIYEVFTNAENKRNNVTLKDNEYFISGKTPTYEYTLFMGNSGLPIKITDKKINISAIIKQAAICKI